MTKQLQDVTPRHIVTLHCGCTARVRGRKTSHPWNILVYMEEICEGHQNGTVPPSYSIRRKGSMRMFNETKMVLHDDLLNFLRTTFVDK